ncbi:YqjF family protein [Pseudonocardia humida]|uniref:DUF2071 domain-containing protein n=1 Tax=Pseudonocardia humida TaxID=2800819 RepID=A0ABT1AD50_9PSEU|nr:DUF2071 domain-containing protein [Pseudonocardia humida]MCO1660992.1 DUF2071 domain-containing protein [Pseudonocardia humida]
MSPHLQSFSDPAPPLAGAAILAQQWRLLTFVHWRVDPELVAPLMPAGTSPDVFDGSTWVGLVPFQMVGTGLGRLPRLPWLGTFAETNVRLYSVDDAGRRGVVFRSLEAARLPVVLVARALFGLPYTWARMRIREVDGEIRYTTARRFPGPRGVGGRIGVRPGAPLPRPEALTRFLTNRWGLHVRHLGRTLYMPNHHGPWPLHEAELTRLDDSLVAAAGLPGLAGRAPDSVLWSPGVPVTFGPPHDARRPRRGH